MEFTAGDRVHFAAPAAAPSHYPVGHSAVPPRQASQPYHYYPTPNPNPNPYPIAPPGTTSAYEPEPDPYAPYGGYEAYHAQQVAYQGYQAPAAAAASYGYPPAAAANSSYASPAAAGYYQATAGGVEAQSSRHYPWWPFLPSDKTASFFSRFQGVLIVCVADMEVAEYMSLRQQARKNTVENLEVKKQKLIEGGTPADSVRVCVVCNVVCNSASVFASHLAGDKHTTKVNGQSSKGLYGGARATVPIQVIPQHANRYLKPSKTIAKVVQSVYCDICKLECNTKEVLAIHKVGKKHMKNLKKLQDSLMRNPASVSAPASSASSGVTGPEKVTAVQQQKKRSQDLEALKQKILENGTPADSIRVCDVCQVVCPSQIVFNSHVAGQKHITLLQLVQQQQLQQQQELVQQQQQ